MEKDSNPGGVDEALKELQSAPLDTRAEFETWLDKLRPRETVNGALLQSPALEHHKPDFLVSCTAGDCQISFDGVMHIDGFVSADIHSENGTLVTGAGLIDGTIDVAAAHIDGSVIGNVRATDRVVLYSGARVAGTIISLGFSSKPGALFEGDCILSDNLPRRMIPFNPESASEFVDQV